MGCTCSKASVDAVDSSDPPTSGNPTSVCHTKYDGSLTEDAPDYEEGIYERNSTGDGWQQRKNACAQNPGANTPANPARGRVAHSN